MATEPKKPATPGKTAGKTTKTAPTRSESKAPVSKTADMPDLSAVESRISALETGLKATESRLAQQMAALETRIGAVEGREAPVQKINLPDGVPEGVRQGIDRAANLVRQNPITALILIIAFLLVAIFN